LPKIGADAMLKDTLNKKIKEIKATLAKYKKQALKVDTNNWSYEVYKPLLVMNNKLERQIEKMKGDG
jgi:hypothetical protein